MDDPEDREDGKSVVIGVRMPAELYRELTKYAGREKRKRNQLICMILAEKCGVNMWPEVDND